MSLISLNAVPPFGMHFSQEPVCVPQFSYWVLGDNSITQLKFVTRELGTIFFNFFGVFEPCLHVARELLV